MREPERRHVLDISEITEQLYIGARPGSGDVAALSALHIDLVLGMTWTPPTRGLKRPPFRLLRIPLVDSPLTPIPMHLLRDGVEAAISCLADGGRVLVYCRAGRHRSVAMTACILIAAGMTAEDAMERVVQRRPVADPHAPYIERRIREFERTWLAEHPRPA